MPGHLPLIEALLDEQAEDLLDDLNLRRLARHEHHPAILDRLALARLQDAIGLLLLIQHQPVTAIRWRSTSAVALPGDLDRPIEDVLAERKAQIRALVTIQALTHVGNQPILLPRKADADIDDLLAALGAERLVVGGQVHVLEPAPATHVEHEDLLEVILCLHPAHHLGEGGPALGIQAALATVGKLLDDLQAVLGGEGPDVVLLDLDGVLLADLGAVAVVGDGSQAGLGFHLVIPLHPPGIHRQFLL